MASVKKESTVLEQDALALEDAIVALKKYCEVHKKKFNESVDIAVNLGTDPKKSDQAVRGSVNLPHGSGKETRVIVFTGDESLQKQALDNGAIEAGLDDLMAKIDAGFMDFDYCIATPEAMPKLSKVAKKLGPRGLMPNAKIGNVTLDIKKAVADAIKGKVNFRNEKNSIVHCAVGKLSFTNEQLLDNIKVILDAIKDLKPQSMKGKYFKGAYLSSTMGCSVKFKIDDLQ